MIENPAYKGPWAPRKIPNPSYFEDKTPSNFEPIGAIGYELWTMTNDILFDNIYVGHSIKDAEKLQKKTFDVKKAIEEAEEAATAPKAPEPPKMPGSFKEDPIAFIKAKIDPFIAVALKDPISAVKAFPDVAGVIGMVIVTILALLGGLISLAVAPAKVKKEAAPASDKKKPEKKIQEAAKAEGSSSESDNKPKASRRTSKKA